MNICIFVTICYAVFYKPKVELFSCWYSFGLFEVEPLTIKYGESVDICNDILNGGYQSKHL